MITNKYKTTLDNLTKLLDTSDSPEVSFETIFSSLKDIVDFDFGAIYFFNSTKLNLRYKHNSELEIQTSLDIDKDVKNKLFSNEILAFEGESVFSKIFTNEEKFSQYLVCPLSIRSTVFGFIILAKKEDIFEKDDFDILTSYSRFCSYIIKDTELMSVFKMQFKVLQDDIEQKTTAYKDIEEQNQKIIEADNQKNEFIANISHELRTPLNAILGFTEVLKEQFFGPLNEKQLEYVGDIHVSAVHLTGMINEILDISKIEANALTLNPTDLEIEQLIKEVVNIISPLAVKKDITISTNVDFEMLYTGDYQKMQQILFNLLSNAIKFTPQKGQIEIGASLYNDNLRLWVKDSGIGIDPKYHGKIFGKFVQLENCKTKKESSTGLGLTITKELVKLHGGNIHVESKLNEGTKFIIDLPLEYEDE